MPKAAVDEDRLVAGGERYVRRTRQVRFVQPITVTLGVQHASDFHLRLSIRASDSPYSAPPELNVFNHSRNPERDDPMVSNRGRSRRPATAIL